MTIIPFDIREGVIWYDGALIPWKEAKLHVLTHGLHYGSCVFEGIRAYKGKIFKLQEHNARLHESARMLDFTLPYSVEELNEACKTVLRENKQRDAYLRPIAWRGSEMLSVAARHNQTHVAIASWEWPAYFTPEQRRQGIGLMMADYCRPDPRTAPVHSKAAGLYMICTICKDRAERAGYADALMLDWRGQVAECTGANVFFVQKGCLHTPTADCFLNGITRRTIMNLAQEANIPCVERTILPHEMSQFSEMFICGTAVELTAVSKCGPYQFKIGPIYEKLLKAFLETTEEGEEILSPLPQELPFKEAVGM